MCVWGGGGGQKNATRKVEKLHTAISKKVIVDTGTESNCGVQAAQVIYCYLATNLHNIECRFIMLPWQYRSVQISTIYYDNLFFEIAAYSYFKKGCHTQ